PTTSGQGKTVLDIMKVKSGCVICDVSRPFDIKESDAIKRPDVLVIASGEVTLPGNVDINIDVGLEGNIVYACLAETALLAMEGKYESFTLSRNINYEKVIEIDRLANEHGVKLSQIMGHNGFISDAEFDLCKEHALENMKKNKKSKKEARD
ncbi:MAG: dehydrogenase, partial [Bdellovibrionales bacterium]|nr:dehydrogenase [Bdellovibrionales bacterium]